MWQVNLVFWTFPCLPSASTSNPPRLLIHFGLHRAFPPLQRPICRACSSLLDFSIPSLRFNVQSAVLAPSIDFPWSIGKRERRSSRFLTPFFYGPEGSRTPVRKPIPCSSTIIVDCLTFPPVHGNQHPCTFSSFMIRPASQSFDTVVSYMFEAWVLKCRCFKSDCCN